MILERNSIFLNNFIIKRKISNIKFILLFLFILVLLLANSWIF